MCHHCRVLCRLMQQLFLIAVSNSLPGSIIHPSIHPPIHPPIHPGPYFLHKKGATGNLLYRICSYFVQLRRQGRTGFFKDFFQHFFAKLFLSFIYLDLIQLFNSKCYINLCFCINYAISLFIVKY